MAERLAVIRILTTAMVALADSELAPLAEVEYLLLGQVMNGVEQELALLVAAVAVAAQEGILQLITTIVGLALAFLGMECHMVDIAWGLVVRTVEEMELRPVVAVVEDDKIRMVGQAATDMQKSGIRYKEAEWSWLNLKAIK